MNSVERSSSLGLDAPDPHSPTGPDQVLRPPRPGRVVAWALVFILTALAAGFWPRWRQREATRTRTRDLAVSTVTVTSPQRAEPSPALPLSAEIRAQTEAPLYGRASGYLRRLHVDLGSPVRAGDILAEIDTPELDAELIQARAQLAESAAALDLAEQTARRWNGLVENRSVSTQENVEKQADFALRSATADAARARLKRLEELKEFSRVVAPFDGTIVERTTDVGDLVSQETPHALFRLADTRKLRVFVRVPQTLTALATPGTPAELTLDHRPGPPFPATVVRTAGTLSPGSRTLLVELAVDNAEGQILAGSYGQVRFQGLVTNRSLSLPANALLFQAEGPKVGIVRSDQTVELRAVTLGRDFGRQVEILDGVSTDEKVILNPRDSLSDGATVQVVEPRS